MSPHHSALNRSQLRSLSLDEALEIARENNPNFLQSRNDESLSNWDVRQAYAALLPTASIGSGVSWQGPGEQQFGSLTLGDLGFGNQPSYYFSNYNIGLNYSIDWRTIKGPAQAKAQRGVTLAQIDLAEASLISNRNQCLRRDTPTTGGLETGSATT